MNDKIEVVCGNCNRKLKAPASSAGKRAKCRTCQEVILIPYPTEEQPLLKSESAAVDWDGNTPTPAPQTTSAVPIIVTDSHGKQNQQASEDLISSDLKPWRRILASWVFWSFIIETMAMIAVLIGMSMTVASAENVIEQINTRRPSNSLVHFRMLCIVGWILLALWLAFWSAVFIPELRIGKPSPWLTIFIPEVRIGISSTLLTTTYGIFLVVGLVGTFGYWRYSESWSHSLDQVVSSRQVTVKRIPSASCC